MALKRYLVSCPFTAHISIFNSETKNKNTQNATKSDSLPSFTEQKFLGIMWERGGFVDFGKCQAKN